jgi:5-methylcytosine-specific restriction protein A
MPIGPSIFDVQPLVRLPVTAIVKRASNRSTRRGIMPLRETLQRILTEYPTAKMAALEGHPLAEFVRGDAETNVSQALGELWKGLIIQGSPGQGNWAAVPWISVFDPAITTSATTGYYVVYLFHTSAPVVHLSLNQGTTKVREEFATRTREILRDRADLMRKRVAEFAQSLTVTTIDLGSDARLPGDYVAGHAIGKTYTLDALPNENELRADLQTIVRAYRALTFRGGTDAEIDSQGDVGEEFDKTNLSITETRKYAYHRKVERNRTAAKQAKKFHGTVCQACDLDFGKRYGPIGEGFIEAHHLKPIASLEEGVSVTYDVAADFAVLCSNCHRMIHRSDDPSDLAIFRALVQSNQT